MIQGGRMPVPLSQENKLWLSWSDSQFIPMLNPANVMDYFSQKSNPFFDRNCNNAQLRMQRVGLDQLQHMVGMEYILLHVCDPILYVIRKQHRVDPNTAIPLTDYYIIAGTIYQAPDLGNVFSSRIFNTVSHLQEAFEEASQYSRYHPNKGYTWDFSSNKALSDKSKSTKKDASDKKEEPASVFQLQRVDMLLYELLNKFPPPINTNQQQLTQPQHGQIKTETLMKMEPEEMSPTDGNAQGVDMKPPPEKKTKM